MAEKRHVVPTEGGWVVKRDSGKSASRRSIHATQRDAVDLAREQVKKAGGGEVIVHGRDGRIRDSDTVFKSAKQRSK